MRTMRQMQAAAKWDTGFAKPEREPPVRVQRLVRRCGVCKKPIAKDATSCKSCGATDFET